MSLSFRFGVLPQPSQAVDSPLLQEGIRLWILLKEMQCLSVKAVQRKEKLLVSWSYLNEMQSLNLPHIQPVKDWRIEA